MVLSQYPGMRDALDQEGQIGLVEKRHGSIRFDNGRPPSGRSENQHRCLVRPDGG